MSPEFQTHVTGRRWGDLALLLLFLAVMLAASPRLRVYYRVQTAPASQAR
jgi:hypothetical protein